MTQTDAGHRDLTMSGRPVTSFLTNVRSLESHLASYLADTLPVCLARSDDTRRSNIVAVTRTCLELAISILDGTDRPDGTTELEEAAANWAREGVAMDAIQHALHEGFKLGFNLVVNQSTPADFDNLKRLSHRLFEVLDIVNATLTHAYVREALSAVGGERQYAVQTLTSALLAGHPYPALARSAGIAIAETYHVVALSIPPHPDEGNPALDGRVIAQRKLRRVQAALTEHGGDEALSVLSAIGGTVLIPTDTVDDAHLDSLVTALSRQAHVPITAAVVDGSVQDMARAAEQAHELLDLVLWLQWQPRLVRFRELALEYQLTRPGRGRDRLGTLLDPLDGYPELLETVRWHISTGFDRQQTARALEVHGNTVDHRLKRVAQLTGLPATDRDGLWYLQSAWVARAHRDRA